MWHLVQKLNESTVYKGTQIDLQSVRFKIRNIYTTHSKEQKDPRPRRPPQPAKCPISKKAAPKEVLVEQNSAIVNKSYTRVTFYTKSCLVYCLIEVSKEMFSYDSEGFLQAEKCMVFVRSYLERCKADSSTHEIVFILYARLYYPQVTNADELLVEVRKYTGRDDITLEDLVEKEGVYQFSKKKVFQDIYLKAGVVTLTLDNTKTDYDKFLVQLKHYLQNFPQIANWQIKCPQNLRQDWAYATQTKDCFRLPCELGDSLRTNILEAINLALFNLNNDETDLDLRKTGT
jgi:hypothetical protein